MDRENNSPSRTTLLAIFEHTDAMERAIDELVHDSVRVEDMFLPVPHHHLLQKIDARPSPVRYFTFTGGTLGLVGGMALAIGTSLVWNLIVAGKPVTSIIPFLVVGFELTILCGAIATLVGLLFLGGLPFISFPKRAYRGVFSLDRFGLLISCAAAQASRISRQLSDCGAETVEEIVEEKKKKQQHHSPESVERKSQSSSVDEGGKSHA